MLKKYKTQIYICNLLILSLLVWHCKKDNTASDYFTPKAVATHFNGDHFAGSATCLECHKDIYESHSNTAHFNTSAKASTKTVKGNFKKEHNTLELQDARLTMIADDESLYQQTEYKYTNKAKTLQKIDLVIGSGVKGQSYLHWKDSALYQLQTSYFSPTNSWINSPNYPKTSIQRSVSDACLKCHVTFAKNTTPKKQSSTYVKEKIILGIDCERCHGPSLKHVTHHRKNPEEPQAKFMTLSDTLTRQQRLDVCAQCHSGLRSQKRKGNPFAFLAGERLADYSKNYYSSRPNTSLDVHGNQYGLLTSSECFKKSAQLDCATCHNPHKNQRGDYNSFNQKCISCHNQNTTDCKNFNDLTTSLKSNCISCHMPLSPSKSMKVQLKNDSLETPVYIRTHLIGIYNK